MYIVARSRIHISLADMGRVSLRAYGGIGFSIDFAPTIMEFEDCETVEIIGADALDLRAQEDLVRIVEKLKAIRDQVRFRATVKATPQQHVGLGSKTALTLSFIAGANAFCKLGLAEHEMQHLSGRGAASGIGVHAFFRGGVLWDAGHRADATTRLSPSSKEAATAIPPLIARVPFPHEWCVALILPDDSKSSGEDEIIFFDNNTPVPKLEALESMAILYHGVLPAFVLKDYEAMATALSGLHNIGFKNRELQRCNIRTRTLLEALHRQRLAAGLSSMGPLLYVIFPRSDRSRLQLIEGVCSRVGARFLGVAEAWNDGYRVGCGTWS